MTERYSHNNKHEINSDIPPDYIHQLDVISQRYQLFTLSEDPQRITADTTDMLAFSRTIITTGTLRDYISYRLAWSHDVPEFEIDVWFSNHGFIRENLPSDAKIPSKYRYQRIYRKAHALIHAFEKYVPVIPTDHQKPGFERISEAVRFIIIQYDNATEKFTPVNNWLTTVPSP